MTTPTPAEPQRSFMSAAPRMASCSTSTWGSHGEPPTCYRVHKETDATRLRWDLPAQHDNVIFETYEYRLEQVKDFNGRTVGFYRGHDVSNVFEQLLVGYKPEGASGDRR